MDIYPAVFNTDMDRNGQDRWSLCQNHGVPRVRPRSCKTTITSVRNNAPEKALNQEREKEEGANLLSSSRDTRGVCGAVRLNQL